MKYYFKLFVLICLISFTNQAISQHDTKSKPILEKLSNQIKSYNSFKAEFTYTLENKEQKIKENKKGTLFVKGAKYKVDFANQLVFCDAKNIWIYIKDANEVQIKDIPTNDDAITPTNIFTIWQKGFKSKYIKEELYNGITSIFIDLVPLKGKSYYKIRLIINKAQNQISSIIIYEKKGSTFTYTINKFNSLPLNDSIFIFKKSDYPKVEEVDMR
jgi:outer membrane lipoprotein-sorting protein